MSMIVNNMATGEDPRQLRDYEILKRAVMLGPPSEIVQRDHVNKTIIIHFSLNAPLLTFRFL